MMAFAIGLVYASHHFFIPAFFLDGQKQVYEPITQASYFDEALLYAPRAHDAFLNFGVRGDFSLTEYQKSPAMLPMLNPLLLGGLAKIFGSMKAGLIASDIIFPTAIFFVIYLVLCELGAGSAASLLFSTIFLVVPQWGTAVPPIHSFQLHTLAQTVFPFLAKADALYFSHFEEPKLTFFFFALCVYTVIRALKRQERKDMIYAGISFGILFYTYLFDWATVATALGLMALFFLITKDYRRFGIIAAIASIGLLVSSYYWVNLSTLRNLPSGKDVWVRLGGEFSHSLRFGTVWKSYGRAIALVALLWMCVRRQAREAIIVLSAVLLSYIVVVNEQVITGFNVQPDHWYRVQFFPIAVSITMLMVYAYRRYIRLFIKTYARGICIMFFLYFFAAALWGQYVYSRERADLFTLAGAYEDIFAWFNTHTPPGSVVGTLSFAENLDIQLHTHNKIFTPFGLSTVAPEDELWQRFMILGSLWGITPAQFTALIHEQGGAYYLFGDEYGLHTFDANFFAHGWSVPDALLTQKTKIYSEFVRANKRLIIPYRLDYLLVDAQISPSWKEPEQLIHSLVKVYDNGRIRIFSLSQ